MCHIFHAAFDLCCNVCAIMRPRARVSWEICLQRLGLIVSAHGTLGLRAVIPYNPVGGFVRLCLRLSLSRFLHDGCVFCR